MFLIVIVFDLPFYYAGWERQKRSFSSEHTVDVKKVVLVSNRVDFNSKVLLDIYEHNCGKKRIMVHYLKIFVIHT